jgi:hypothetical protein
MIDMKNYPSCAPSTLHSYVSDIIMPLHYETLTPILSPSIEDNGDSVFGIRILCEEVSIREIGDGSGKEGSSDDEECKLISLNNFNGFKLLNDRENNNNKTLASS